MDGAAAPDVAQRVEELEKQLRLMRAELDEMKDVQLMEKMDLVNLRNELESLEMANPQLARQKTDARSIDELAAELKEIHGQLRQGVLNVCKGCGNVLPSGAKFCGKCGGKA